MIIYQNRGHSNDKIMWPSIYIYNPQSTELTIDKFNNRFFEYKY